MRTYKIIKALESFGWNVHVLHGKDSTSVSICYTAKNKDRSLNKYAIGFAQCGKSDNYDKEKGRKVALTRAIKNAFPNKEARKIIYNAARINVGDY